MEDLYARSRIRGDNEQRISSHYLRIPPKEKCEKTQKEKITDQFHRMKRYVHNMKKQPKRDWSEGHEFEDAEVLSPRSQKKKAHGLPEWQHTEGTNILSTGCRIELSVDPATLDEKKNKEFLVALAQLLHVRPDALTIRTLSAARAAGDIEDEEDGAPEEAEAEVIGS